MSEFMQMPISEMEPSLHPAIFLTRTERIRLLTVHGRPRSAESRKPFGALNRRASIREVHGGALAGQARASVLRSLITILERKGGKS
jgi:hypothetical protein